jgi:hypothetical protein
MQDPDLAERQARDIDGIAAPAPLQPDEPPGGFLVVRRR